ncbi:MAG TPA: hypothetical protein ACHBX0_02785 [Arsenophonus sp.]
MSALYNQIDKDNVLSGNVMLSSFSQQTVENKGHIDLDNEVWVEYINDEGQFVN